MIRRHAIGILTALGLGHEQAEDIIWHHGMNRARGGLPDAESLYDLERSLNHRISAAIPEFKVQLDAAMTKRAEVVARWISPFIERGTSVLDFGGGSGHIARHLRVHNENSVTIADVIDWRATDDVSYVPVVDERTNELDKSHEYVALLTAGHHSQKPERVICEVFRLARRRVIIIESVTNTLLEFIYGCWIDWFYNRVIHFNDDPTKKISVPCKFFPASGWEQLIWDLTDLRPKEVIPLGIHQDLNPENHCVFIYDV